MSSRNRQQTTQTQNQAYNNTNTYGWMTPPDTSDIAAMRGFQFTADPRVPYTFGKARQNINESYHNPMGGNYTAGLRDAQLRASYEDLGQQEAQALREESHALQGLNYAQLADIANMTQPRMIQTGGSGTSSGNSTGSTVQSQSLLPSLIQGGSAVGSALIM